MDCAGISDGQAIRSCGFAMFDLFIQLPPCTTYIYINILHDYMYIYINIMYTYNIVYIITNINLEHLA